MRNEERRDGGSGIFEWFGRLQQLSNTHSKHILPLIRSLPETTNSLACYQSTSLPKIDIFPKSLQPWSQSDNYCWACIIIRQTMAGQLKVRNESSTPLQVYLAGNLLPLDAHSTLHFPGLLIGAYPVQFVVTGTGQTIDRRIIPEAAEEVVVKSNMDVQLVNRFNFLRDAD